MVLLEPRLGSFGECLNCTAFDLYDIFSFESSNRMHPIKFRDAFANKEICAFCRLLAQTARKFTPHQVVGHREGVQVTFSFSLQHFQDTATELGSRFLHVTIYPPPSPLDMDKELTFRIIPISESLPESLYHRIDQDKIDLEICRKWVTKCEREHNSQCGAFSSPTNSRPESSFRLIDVVDECIVVPPPSCQYVALSYVWGRTQYLQLNSQTAPILAEKGSLFSQETPVGQTITDAITVVKALGERYLWVDQLCISQDESDKAIHIKSMDRVYGAALLTIVAADGMDANAGLPGVRPGTRTRNINQLHEDIWPGFSIATTIDLPLDPAGSVWGTRGWTFQEQLLSKRLLLFYQGSVFWQCRNARYCEDAPALIKAEAEQVHWLEQLSPRWAKDKAPLQHIEKQWDENQEGCAPAPLCRPVVFTEYARAVKEYTKRRLTFSDDIINAFEGISSQLSHHMGNNFLAALPESYLDIALLWTPSVLQTRRKSKQSQQTLFPSWSWAGWIGQAEYDAPGPDGKEWIELTTKWYIKDGPAAPRLANGVGMGIDEVPLGCNLSTNALCWDPIFESVGGHSGKRPEVELPNMQGPYLQFWTSCSFFTIVHRKWRDPESLQMNSSVRKPIHAHIHCTKGSKRQLAGYLILNGEGPNEVMQGKHEFVVLSGALAKGFNSITGNVTYSDEAEMYNVMLVEWDDQHQIASRLGTGRIFKEAWDMSLPTIRCITLG
ncbi:hypothetical protein TASIC1_0006012200 [Trichoderma asperellum]|uniref:Heterokaryon incompatibility domain-containing protein n=1 Tax=Trichoderma asperellum TaxID=101201 RepID=A0A6V8QV68_TRIAP|nr:HET-domain-containing protein [Trichoderma asperelloides]GFP55952.1 hypothetical protein TASIC1_0006012200 [Trichoderma asperellum]